METGREVAISYTISKDVAAQAVQHGPPAASRKASARPSAAWYESDATRLSPMAGDGAVLATTPRRGADRPSRHGR
jgi:hypothetical protein